MAWRTVHQQNLMGGMVKERAIRQSLSLRQNLLETGSIHRAQSQLEISVHIA